MGSPARTQAITIAPQPVTLASTLSPLSTDTAVAPGTGETALHLAAARAPGDSATLATSTTPAPAPPAAPVSTQPPCDPGVSGLYCVYTVRPGDTLSKIATQFGLKGSEGVSPWELLVQSNKPDIVSAEDYIQAGQKLRIPLKNGVVHTVLTGETLSELASDYGVPLASIADAGSLTIGQELLIPNPTRIPQPRAAAAPAATPEPEETATPTSTATADAAEVTETPVAADSATATATRTPRSTVTGTRTPARGTPVANRSGFIWPVTGPISSYFGPAHPLGIDIDLYANPNAPIAAAAAGTVTFAGGNTCCSYGLYVIIDHGNGYTTLYAHFSSISVSQGQKVTQGQLLGYGGRTGYATGDHLHFEVRLNDAIIDPLSVLP